MTEVILFPTLFIALFVQVFALLTFISRDARERREKEKIGGSFPRVAVVVPCFNEEQTIRATVESLLALDYPREHLELILVNDGSTDNTRAIMDSYHGQPSITVIHKENGGKHTALNAALEKTNAEFIGCLDADSFVSTDALREVIAYFDNPKVAAVTASMTVHAPSTVIQHMQYAEYLIGITLRHVLASINGLYVTPGPFSFYRKSVLDMVGGFTEGHRTEDMEMALRLQRNEYWIENAPRALVSTTAPRTLWALIKQRTRWTSGFMRNAFDYRDLFFNYRHGVLGLLVLPSGILAIITSLTLFFFVLYDLINGITTTLTTIGEVPLSHLLALPTLDWFYIPITASVLFGVLGILSTMLIMGIGRHITRTTRPLLRDALSFFIFYAFIAPLWILRAARDVALGYHRAWR